MKQTNKYFLFSNFKDELLKHTTKNELTIHTALNVTAQNNIIEPTNAFVPLINKILKNKNLEIYFNTNESLVNHILWIGPYQYFNNDLYSFKTRLFAISQGLYLYEFDFETNKFNSTNIQFYSYPQIFTLNNSLIFNSINDKTVEIVNAEQPVVFASPLTFYCEYSNMIIFSKNNEMFNVCISTNTDIKECLNDEIIISTFEFKAEDGLILKIMPFGNSLIVFQQYKISKLTFSNASWKQSVVCVINVKIVPETICLVNDNIMFCSSKDMFIFDGSNIKQLYQNLTINCYLGGSNAVCHDNKYYLNTWLKMQPLNENVLIEFDIQNNKFKIYEIGNIANLYTIKTPGFYHLCAVPIINNKCRVKTLDYSLTAIDHMHIKFNKISFDSSLRKFLKNIKFQAIGDFVFTIRSENDYIRFNAKDNFEINDIALPAHCFQFEIDADGPFEIESIFVETMEYIETNK